MNPRYFGDSYDLVKRFFCIELQALGYAISVEPMVTSPWENIGASFFKLIGINSSSTSFRKALFVDPDTGVRKQSGPHHATFAFLAHSAKQFDLVFSFDQSFSRQANSLEAMREKLSEIQKLECHGMYFNSHARFLFVSTNKSILEEIHAHLLDTGLPASRLLID